MSAQLKKLMKNYWFSLSSNLISFMISAIVIAVVPKLIGAAEYGYFQLFILYTSYVGFFHFGWCDGIYLRYGGQYYDKLDKKKMSGQFWSLSVFELAVTIILFAAIFVINPGEEKGFILFISAFSILFVIPKTMLSYLLQLSNRIKEYSVITIIEKLVYCVIVIAVLALGMRDYKMLIYADIAGKLVALIVGVVYCRDIVFSKLEPIKQSLAETWANISVGIKLMVANVAGMLILGIVRLAIEDHWGIEVFGKVSLTVSVSNMMLMFVSAIGIVIFPMIKRVDSGRLNDIYDKLRDCLMVAFFGLMIFYYPAKSILSLWLPGYEESFRYMALLFPICIFEGKMSMLINTYMKALRMENMLLVINICTVALSLVLTGVAVYSVGNLEMSIVIILVLFGFRCVLCEIFLSKAMEKNVIRDIIYELILVAAFVIVTWFINSWVSCLLYGLCYMIYLFLKRKEIGNMAKKILKVKHS